MSRLIFYVCVLCSIAAAPPLANAAEVNMAGVAYITFEDIQDETTDAHVKGVSEGTGIYIPNDSSHPAANAMIDFDVVFHSATRDDIDYIQRTGAYGAMILSDSDQDYLILGYVRHPGTQVQWVANGGSGKYANASGKGEMVFELLQSTDSGAAGKFTFSGSITLD